MPEKEDKKNENIANDNKGMKSSPDLIQHIKASHNSTNELHFKKRKRDLLGGLNLEEVLMHVDDIAIDEKDKAFLREGLKFVYSIAAEETEINDETAYIHAKEKLRHVYARLISDDVFTESNRHFIFNLGHSMRMTNHQIFNIIGQKRATFESYEQKRLSTGKKNNILRLASHIIDIVHFAKASEIKKTRWQKWKQKVRIFAKKFYRILKESARTVRHIAKFALRTPREMLKWGFGKAHRFKRRARVAEYKLSKNIASNFNTKPFRTTTQKTNNKEKQTQPTKKASLKTSSQTDMLRASIQMKLNNKLQRG